MCFSLHFFTHIDGCLGFFLCFLSFFGAHALKMVGHYYMYLIWMLYPECKPACIPKGIRKKNSEQCCVFNCYKQLYSTHCEYDGL